MTNRQYTVYGSEDMIKMLLKMETSEAKEKYSLRPAVESPYGTLKQYYEINQLPYTGKYNTRHCKLKIHSLQSNQNNKFSFTRFII